MTLEKRGRRTRVFTHGSFPLQADTHTQAHASPALGCKYLCLPACPVAEEKELGLEGGLAAREYNPSASPPAQSQPYDCWDR